MSYDQYRNDPDAWRRQYQPRQINYLPWILGCCVLPFLVCMGVMGWWFVRVSRWMSGQESIMAGSLPKAGVRQGTALAWQEPLGRRQMMGAHIDCGDFDGDGSEELLLSGVSSMDFRGLRQQMQNPQQNSSPYQLITVLPDGSSSATDTSTSPYLNETAVWDYGNDGKDEIVDLWNSGGQIQVLDSTLNPLASLPGGGGFSYGPNTADLDGDGIMELVANDAGNSTYMAFDHSGQLLASITASGSQQHPVWADMDGDGRAELVFADSYSTSPRLIVRRDGQPDEIISGGWSETAWPVLAHDVDGDGIDELFASHYGYYDVARGSFTRFQFPPTYTDRDPSCEVLPVDIDGDGDMEFATGGSSFSLDSALFLFDETGQCLYYEEFGATVEGKGVIRDSGGREHLVIQLDNRILLYP